MIRLALVGAGVHAHDHARAVASLRAAGRDVRIELVVDPVTARAAGLAGEFGVPHCGAPDLLGQVDVDAADVCAPTDAHVALAETCAGLGLPTLIEKPLAPTLAGADRILDAFATAGVPLFPGHSTRFDPVARHLHSVASDGALGEVGLVAIHHAQGYAWADGWRAWQHDAVRSGGRIVHLGIHDLDLACWLVGAAPVQVAAIGRPQAPGRAGSWASYSLQATFANGALALVTATWDVVPAELMRKTCLVIGSLGRASHDSADDELLVSGARAGSAPVGYAPALQGQINHWLDCIEGRAEPVVTPRQARTALALAVAGEQSAAAGGETIAIEEVPGAR